MRPIALFVCITLLLVGCEEGAKVAVRPDDVLAPDKMAKLLTLAHLQEARLQTRRLRTPEAKGMFDHYWDSTAKANGTDTATFAKSFDWYTSNVGEMDAVYERVTDSIAVEESRVNSKGTTPKPANGTAPAPDSAGKTATPAGTGLQTEAPVDHH